MADRVHRAFVTISGADIYRVYVSDAGDPVRITRQGMRPRGGEIPHSDLHSFDQLEFLLRDIRTHAFEAPASDVEEYARGSIDVWELYDRKIARARADRMPQDGEE